MIIVALILLALAVVGLGAALIVCIEADEDALDYAMGDEAADLSDTKQENCRRATDCKNY